MSTDPLRDPEAVELDHLLAACQLTGSDILEIGCGNGRLTWQYAHLPHLLIGIDPHPPDLLIAKTTPSPPLLNVSFAQAVGEALPFLHKTFDVAIFTSSL